MFNKQKLLENLAVQNFVIPAVTKCPTYVYVSPLRIHLPQNLMRE